MSSFSKNVSNVFFFFVGTPDFLGNGFLEELEVGLWRGGVSV